MTERNLGDGNFNWWIGKVVNVNDPQQSGRVQVRVYGRHDDFTNIPDESLPWALPIQPATSAATGRMGTAPVGLVKDSIIAGFWADTDHQYPIFWGAIGKAGDAVEGATQNGAPKVNTDTGSIPSASIGVATNYRSQLNSSTTSISEIDSRGANTSVSSNTGIIMTKSVEDGMKNAKTPTIANQPATNDVVSLLRSVDPFSKNASLPCINLSFFTLKSLMGLLVSLAGSIVGALKDALIKAINGAIIKLAQKYGVTKILGQIQQAAQEIAEVQQLLNALNIKICGVNIFNQGIFDAANAIIAETLYVLQHLTLNGLIRFVDGVITGATNVLFNDLVVEPAATFVKNNSKPDNLVDPSNVPGNYVQNYVAAKDDLNPGYIEYIDPSGQGQPVFIPRNGQPNYLSAQQHIQFDIQRAVLPQFENALINGVLNGSGLTNLFNGAMSVAKATSALRTLGNAAGKLIGVGAGIGTGLVGLGITAGSLAVATGIWSSQQVMSDHPLGNGLLPFVPLKVSSIVAGTVGEYNGVMMAKYALSMVGIERKALAMNAGLGGASHLKGMIGL